MKHVIIGTAGHVDHGKTTLIKALTGTDTDRLKEEQERGMTIDLGFAALTLPDGTPAGIVDVPGHERFLKNMLAGAGGVDVVLLVIAADESVMPQTKEHLDIVRLLDVKNGVVALTKADMVDQDWLEIVEDDVRSQFEGTFLETAPIIRVNSLKGTGIPELKKALLSAVSRTEQKNTAIPFRLPVDRVFTRPGFGTVVTGTLVAGTIERAIPLEDEEAIIELARSCRIGFAAGEDGGQRVLLDDRDVTDEIRSKEATRLSSPVSAIPGVRRVLVAQQQAMGAGGGVVMEGRDIGTVVFPDAEVKVFLTATEEERAHRRWKERTAKGDAVTVEEILQQQRERDARDSSRSDSPLAAAPDAVTLESDGIPFEGVVARILQLTRERGV